jgi:hypothetical protein
MTSPYITTGFDDEYTGGLSVKFDSDTERIIFAMFVLLILYWVYVTFICPYYSYPFKRSFMIAV